MNERIKQFAEQAGLIADGEHWFSAIQETDVRSIDLERFAELVRQDERQALAQEQTKCPRCGKVNPAEIHTCSPQVAQPEQEPVGYVENRNLKWCNGKTFGDMDKVDGYRLYTAPPKRNWVGLTNEEVDAIRNNIFEKYKKALLVTRDVTNENNYSAFNFYQAIEKKLRSKND